MPDRRNRRDNATTKSQRYVEAPNHTIIHLGGPNPGRGETGIPGGVTGYLTIGGFWWVPAP